MTEKYEVHPACELMPKLEPEEFAELVETIRREGLLQPIVVCRGKILDGRHRLLACLEAGVQPQFTEWDGKGSPWMYVWTANNNRRHLDKFQRTALWVKFARMSGELGEVEGEARARRVRNLKQFAADGAEAREERAPDTLPLEHVSQPESARRAPSVDADAGGTSAPESVSRPESALRALSAGGTAVAPNGAAEADGDSASVDDFSGVRSHDHIAAQHGISRRSTAEILSIEKHAPEVFDRLATGKITMSQAKAMARFAKSRKDAEVDTQGSATPSAPARVRKMDALDFLEQFDPESIDVLVTDPPSGEAAGDIAGFVGEWLPLALSRLRQSAHAYICLSPSALELHVYLQQLERERVIQATEIIHWVYRNTLGRRSHHAHTHNWHPILHVVGPDAPPLVLATTSDQMAVWDIRAPGGKHRLAPDQKPDQLAERIIRAASAKGELVVDPFAGTGTFLLAAARMGRQAIGCDNSEDAIALALQRGCEREN